MLVDNNRMFEMMKSYQADINRTGNTESERKTNQLIQARRNFLQISPTAKVIIHNGIERLVHITDRSHINKDIRDKYVYFEPGVVVYPGDFINWNDEFYMIEEVEDPVVKNDTGVTIIPLNEVLTWQDKNGNIYQLPCNMSNLTSIYSDGTTRTGGLVTLPIDQVAISIQKNEFTQNFNTNKRFMFGKDPKRVFEIQRRIYNANPGIIAYALKRCGYSKDKDRIEYNLTNFIDFPDTPTIENIVGKKEIIWGQDYKYTLPENYRAKSWYFMKVDNEGNNITKPNSVEVKNIMSNSVEIRVKSLRELGQYVLIANVTDNNGNERRLELPIMVIN